MRRVRCAALGLVLSLSAAGCSESFQLAVANHAVGSITGPLPGTLAVPFTITGSDYTQVISDQATVTFTAFSGTPFEGGTAATVEVAGTIASDTTINGTSPLAVIAGPDQVDAQVVVTLPSGVQVPAGDATFVPPTLTGLAGDGMFPSAIPTGFTLNGANFGPVGGEVTIQLTSADPIFPGTTTTVTGTIDSTTEISAVSPTAVVCGPASVAAVIDRVAFPDGSTTPDGTSVDVTFLAPTVTGIVNTVTGSPHENSSNFAAAIPEAFTLSGTGFGPMNGTAIVRFTAPSPIFNGQAFVDVNGTIVDDTTITGTSPPAAVCNGAVVDVTVLPTLPNGSCPPATVAAAVLAPTLVSLENTDRGGTDFFAALPEAFRITGTDFGPDGQPATVTFTAAATTPFGGLATAQVTGTIMGRDTIVGTSPQATLCPAPPGQAGSNSLNDALTVGVTLPGGSCAPDDLASQMFGPAISSLNAPSTPPVDVPSTILIGETDAEDFTITGTGFGPVGGTATVTFADATGGTPFDGAASTNAVGTIVDENTITGTLPTITAPRLGADLAARVTVTLNNQSCAFYNELANFVAPPTITDVENQRAPFDPDDTSASLDATFLPRISTPAHIEGTGFATGLVESIFDTAAGDGTPIGGGKLQGTVTVTGTLITGDSPTDTTIDAPVDATVRVVNPDNQYHEFESITFDTTGVLPNVNGSKQLFTEAEMHLCVNPMDKLNAAICSHDGGSGFSQVRHIFTKDGGATWTNLAVGPAGSASADGLAPLAFRFDPMNACDAFGNIYVIYGGDNSSTGVRSIFVHQSRDGGSTFASVTQLSFPASASLDRWTAATGPDGTRPGNQALYVGLVDFGTGTASNIVVGGMSIRPDGSVAEIFPFKLVNDAASAGGRFFQHGTPSVGPSGELYVSFIDAAGNFVDPTLIKFDVDPDGLAAASVGTFGTDTLAATTDMRGFRIGVTPMPSRGYPCIPMHKVIRTGPNAGRIVMTYTDADSVGNDMDVVTVYSDNDGMTWSTPALVHSVSTKHQFHPWMDADPVTGKLVITWYDTKNAANNRACERYSAVSTDGATWGSALLLSQAASDATTIGVNDYLEYNGVGIVDNCIYACWADNSNFTLDNPGGTLVREQFDVMTAFYMQDEDD